MKAFTKKVLGRAAGITLVIGMTATPVIADQWKTASELRTGQSSSADQQTSQVSATTSKDFLKHRAPLSVTSGERMSLRAKVAGKDGVKLARVYFKTAAAERYNFVVLNKGDRGIYSATIPAAGSNVSAVEYKIVVQNAFGEVYKTDKYSVPVNVSDNNQVAQKDGFIDVFSEYPEKAAETSGFVDNVRYTYSASKLVTSLGSTVSVGSSGSGYVGSASSSATGTAGTSATTTASTTASTSTAASTGAAAGSTASTVSATTVAAVGAGSIAVVAVADPSGESGDCFDGLIQITTTDVDPEFGEVEVVLEYSDGFPRSLSGYSSTQGCLSESSTELESQSIDASDADLTPVCLTDDILSESLNSAELDGVSIEFVSNHRCPVIFTFTY